jgi:hypothetical protein
MKHQNIRAIVITVASLCVVVSMAVAAQQDRFSLKAPNGVAFSEFRGYDTWQAVAPSQTDDGVKVIVGNTVLINGFKEGIPGNGKPVPDGAMFAKIEWSKKKNSQSPYAVTVPDTLKSVAFMEKDSKRFPDTNGWGYAQFMYDAASNSFKPFGNDSSFGKTVCHQCHTRVKANDYVFTSYAPR